MREASSDNKQLDVEQTKITSNNSVSTGRPEDMTSIGHSSEQQQQQESRTALKELNFEPPFQLKTTKKSKVPGNEKAGGVAKRPPKVRYNQFLNRQNSSHPKRPRAKPGSRSF